ncbi:MAG TPA: B12-binding domain-containing radical SAM protein [Candidatus Woesearchaeota archaeon]|nr:B12-binding domain-containing radical SAM protein [Candidatus Woesearchaeota archaeon]
MHEKPRIAFVDLNQGLKTGHVNIGLLEIISFLKKELDFSFRFFDRLSPELFSRRFHIVAFSACGLSLEQQTKKNRRFFSKIRALKIAGGPGPTVQPEKALAISDISVLGEGEPTLKAIIELFIESGSAPGLLNNTGLQDVPNLCFRRKSEIIRTKREFFPELEIPRTDWGIAPNLEKYIKNWPYLDYLKKRRGVSFSSSRSCPFQCTFCQPTVESIFGRKLKHKRVDFILSELKYLKKHHNINSFMLHDDSFTVNEDYVNSFCNSLIKLKEDSGLSFDWICNTRADLVKPGLARLMRQAGCVEVRLGIETLDEENRNKLLRKALPQGTIKEAINALKQERIKTLGFFMIGFPNKGLWETLREIWKISGLSLDLATFSVLTALPGTELGKKYKKSTFSSYYTSSKDSLSGIPPFFLKLLKLYAFIAFYTHPKRFLTTLKQTLKIKTLFYKLKRLLE